MSKLAANLSSILERINAASLIRPQVLNKLQYDNKIVH